MKKETNLQQDDSALSQNEQILRWLILNPNTLITGLQALYKFGTMKLSTRIHEVSRQYGVELQQINNVNTEYFTKSDEGYTLSYGQFNWHSPESLEAAKKNYKPTRNIEVSAYYVTSEESLRLFSKYFF